MSQRSVTVTNTWAQIVCKEERFIWAHGFGGLGPRSFNGGPLCVGHVLKQNVTAEGQGIAKPDTRVGPGSKERRKRRRWGAITPLRIQSPMAFL